MAIRNGPPLVTGELVTLFSFLTDEDEDGGAEDGKESQGGIVRADPTRIRIWSREHKRGGQEVQGTSTDGEASDRMRATPGTESGRAEESDAGTGQRFYRRDIKRGSESPS